MTADSNGLSIRNYRTLEDVRKLKEDEFRYLTLTEFSNINRRLTGLEEDVKLVRSSLKAHKAEHRWWNRLVAGGIVSAIFTGIGSIAYFLKR